MIFADFYKGKRVLITGHTGFKGGWLSIWLGQLGAEVAGISLAPNTQPNLFELARLSEIQQTSYCDICDQKKLAALIQDYNPEIVFHLAAQPLVFAGYQDPVGTFQTNIMGTVHVLESLRELEQLKVTVMITTDKVYKNQEWVYPYREEDALGGYDPYSASKAGAEIVIASYRDSFLREKGVAVSSARAGNVIGGGDWSSDRLIPDAIRAWSSGESLQIRSPEAIRPWQHVLDPLAGYLILAKQMWEDQELSGVWNFGPDTCQNTTVRQLIEIACSEYGPCDVEFIENWGGKHEAGRLELENAKSRSILGVKPAWDVQKAVRMAIKWYLQLDQGASALKLCQEQIREYEAELSKNV